MPYKAKLGQWNPISYLWNKIFAPIENIKTSTVGDMKLINESIDARKDMLHHLANLDNAIFRATTSFFNDINAKWCNVPITTLMISSPGEVYGGQTLNYTTDTLPIEIQGWFDNHKRIFLSESSQLYLELALCWANMDKVFSIYNSFRKEQSDFSHLTEFQHIEFEGKVWFEENIDLFSQLFVCITNYVMEHNIADLEYFLTAEQLQEKQDILKKWIKKISLKEGLNILWEDTKDDKYKEFSLKHFGSREEIRLSEIIWGNYIVHSFPMLQIPFYHDIAEEEVDWHPIAKNADMILYRYREVIGSGQRIKDKNVLMKKAEIFKLPHEDYLPYLKSRGSSEYRTTSWFWLWWQRLMHWFTNQPMITEATVFPRTHLVPNP